MFRSAAWSPAGLGPLGTCLVAALDSEFDLHLLHATHNALRGPWCLSCCLDAHRNRPSEGETPDQQRHRTLGDQVTHAAWSTKHARSSALLAAGTRSGEVLIWTCWGSGKVSDPVRIQVANQVVQEVLWADKMVLEAGDTPCGTARLTLAAIIARKGVRLLDIIVSGTGIQCTLLDKQPPFFADGPDVTRVQLLQSGDVIATTPGQFHIWRGSEGTANAGSHQTPEWTSVQLLSDVSPHDAFLGEEQRNPFAACVSLDVQGETATITLASGLQYRIEIPEHRTVTAGVAPSRLVSTVRERDLVLQALKQRLESHQKLAGWHAADSPSAQSVNLVAVLQSDDEIAAYRLLTHKHVKVSLSALIPSGNSNSQGPRAASLASLEALLDQAIQQGLRSADERSSIHALRPALAIYHSALNAVQNVSNTDESSPSMHDVRYKLLEIVARAVTARDVDEPVVRRRLYWLAAWSLSELESHSDWTHSESEDEGSRDLATKLSVARARLEALLLVEHLIASLARFDKTGRKSQSKDLLRGVGKAILGALESAGSKRIKEDAAWQKQAAKKLKAALGQSEDNTSVHNAESAVDLGETCPACKEKILFDTRPPAKSSAATGDLPFDRIKAPDISFCARGHRWSKCQTFLPKSSWAVPLTLLLLPPFRLCVDRCQRTFEIVTFGVKTCVGCRAKQSMSPTSSATLTSREKQAEDIGGDADERCYLCGNQWIQLT